MGQFYYLQLASSIDYSIGVNQSCCRWLDGPITVKLNQPMKLTRNGETDDLIWNKQNLLQKNVCKIHHCPKVRSVSRTCMHLSIAYTEHL